jgi:ADYC domain
MNGVSARTFARCCTLAAMLAAGASALARAEPSLQVEGTEFVLTTASGHTLRSFDLQGTVLRITVNGRDVEVTIRSVEDDSQATGGRIVLHHFVVDDGSGGTMALCDPDPDGRSLGFPVPDGRGDFDLTCTSGVIGKCIRWGYRPWEERPGGPPLRALHHACVRMARADYGGDDQTTTRDGTLIHVYDRFGIRPAHRDVPMAFEAAWGVDGAICVAHPRIPENISLHELGERYPRLKSHLGPASCTEEGALQNPNVLLFNRSAR